MMPYKLRGNCVVKADSGDVVKCHDTHAQALAHLRALEANVTDAKNDKAFQGKLTQQEVGYVPLSPQITSEACANCRWFMNPGCFIVESWEPEPVMATGYCDRHEANPAPPPSVNMDNPMPVMIVEPTIMEDDSAEMALPMPTDRKGLKSLISDMFKAPTTPSPTKAKERAIVAWKGSDGEYYWLARHTGKYVDREDEIIADKAHEEYVARVQKGLVDMPELWTWHKKGTKHGEALFVWKAGGFVLALGKFVGTNAQKERAVKYYQDHPDTKLSHMFHFPHNGKQNKVYYAYNTVEITTLPDGAEAFPYTTFEVNNMPFTKAQEEMIRGIGGDEMLQRAQAADTKALIDTTKMDAAGVASKGHENFEGSTIPGQDETKALMAAQKDFDARLKVVENLPALVASLDASVKALVAQMSNSQTVVNQALEKANDNEKKLLEYQAVQPPASKSNDTLLSEREKNLIDGIAAQAKSNGSKSLIEQIFGGQPTVTN